MFYIDYNRRSLRRRNIMFNVREQLDNKMRKWSMKHQPQSWLITAEGYGILIDDNFNVKFVDPETGRLVSA
jgi:hypothetical protein